MVLLAHQDERTILGTAHIDILRWQTNGYRVAGLSFFDSALLLLAFPNDAAATQPDLHIVMMMPHDASIEDIVRSASGLHNRTCDADTLQCYDTAFEMLSEEENVSLPMSCFKFLRNPQEPGAAPWIQYWTHNDFL
jgi:hypothetical protein